MSRDVEIFMDALRRDGYYEGFMQYLNAVAELIPYYAHGTIKYQICLYLPNIQEYYDLRVLLIFDNDDRSSMVTLAKKITMDEYIELVYTKDYYCRETYNKLLEFFK